MYVHAVYPPPDERRLQPARRFDKHGRGRGLKGRDRVAKGANAKTPLFIGHGTEDQTVYPECGADARDRFKAAGVDVTFMDYPAAHGSHPAGMAGLRAWFVDVLKVQE